jgi:hypothetical protein
LLRWFARDGDIYKALNGNKFQVLLCFKGTSLIAHDDCIMEWFYARLMQEDIKCKTSKVRNRKYTTLIVYNKPEANMTFLEIIQILEGKNVPLHPKIKFLRELLM